MDFLEKYKADKEATITAKKSAFKVMDSVLDSCVRTPHKLKCTSSDGCVTKADYTLKATDSEEVDTLKRTIIASTNNWMDSHGDVHVKGCFGSSDDDFVMASHLHDHEFKITSQIGKVQSYKERKIAWKTLGIDKDGFTTSLFVDTLVKRSLNEQFFNLYKSGDVNQHSVGMKYIDIVLAVNSEEKWAEDEKKNWDEFYDKVANKEEIGSHFWVVKKAQMIEVSAVLRGSNVLTPTIKFGFVDVDGVDDNEPKQTMEQKVAYIRKNLSILK